jgi:hypothetical protein
VASLAPSFGTSAFAQLPTLPVGLPEITGPKIGAQARSEAVVDYLPTPIGTGSKDEVLQTLAVMISTSLPGTTDGVWLDVDPRAWKLGSDFPTGSTRIFQIDVSRADPTIDIPGLVPLTVGYTTQVRIDRKGLCGLTNAPDSLAAMALPSVLPKRADLVDVAQKQVALVQYAVGREKAALDVEQGVLNPATAASIYANNKLSDATPAGGVTISSPKSGATVSGTVSIVVQNVAPVSWVNVYIDGNWAASSPRYTTMAWNSTSVANGQYAIAVNGYNSSNALVATTAMNVNVQNGGGPTPTPVPTATPSSTGSPVGYYSLLPSGSALPSDSQCASGVAGDNFEPVPQNAPQNTYTPSTSDLSSYVSKASGGEAGAPGSFLTRADGQFTGTTDAILKWASCKWGFDENVTRATAVNETHWRQTEFGDIGNGTSIGILQIKSRDYPSSCEAVATSQNTSLVTDATCYSYLSTAFAADYKLAQQRACFEGKVSYMIGESPAGYPSYPNGTPDQIMWGCVGWWYSGHWYDSGAVNYISQVKGYLAGQPWLSGGVGY